MDNFKRKKPAAKRPASLSGFVSNSAPIEASGGVKKQFRKSYRPKKNNQDPNSIAISDVSSSREGFQSKGLDISKPQNPFNTDSNPKPKKRFFKKKTKSKRKKRSIKKFFVRGFVTVFILLLLAGGAFAGYFYINASQVFRGNGDGAAALEKNVDPAKLDGEGDGRINILLIGKGGPGHDAPDLTDTLLLASIDPVQNEAALLSIPRDMYVHDSRNNSMKINAIYATAKQAQLTGDDSDAELQAAEDAGLDAIKQTVSEVIGLPVHYYVMVNFEAFEDAINIVGGIDIDVQEPLYDPTVAWLLGGDPLVADKGLQTFNGKRALLYARSRKGSARGDFDRTERQREIIVGLQEKILSAGTFSNPFKVVELLRTFGDNVRTDLNGVDEIKRLYEIAQEVGANNIISVGLADDPILVATDFAGTQSIVRPLAGLYQYDDIHSFVRNTLKDPYLRQENARVFILNGTSITGLADAKEKELNSYGYQIISVDNAPTSSYTSSRLIDLTNGELKYTKSYLQKRLGLNAETTVIPGLPTQDEADFVIILGTDEKDF